MNPESQPRQSKMVTLPGAIIIAGALVAVAIMWTKKTPPAPPASAAANQAATAGADQVANVNIPPVTAADHILGNPNAPIKIVEYSDPSCPFCKMFNPTMVKVIDQYGPTGKVAWIYRHFPLDKPDANGDVLHKNAGHEAEALECAASLGGNDKFWAYEKRLYEVTPSVTSQTPDGLDQKQLPIIATYVGIDAAAFTDCVASNRFKDKIEKQYTDGINAGVRGTPTSFVITPTGSKIPLTGAQTLATMKSTIETLVTEIKQ
jgi:protein-disulfide isomerase